MPTAPRELDVRPILRAGGEPFAAIIGAVEDLEPGQALRLFATFQPVPLFGVLAKRGFDHVAQELDNGDWEVMFTPAKPKAGHQQSKLIEQPEVESAVGDWPAPSRHLDNRDLEAPEPMVRTLAAVEEMGPGQVLCALLCREPVFLLPQLRERGHAWRGGFEPDGTTYKLLIRIGAGKQAAA